MHGDARPSRAPTSSEFALSYPRSMQLCSTSTLGSRRSKATSRRRQRTLRLELDDPAAAHHGLQLGRRQREDAAGLGDDDGLSLVGGVLLHGRPPDERCVGKVDADLSSVDATKPHYHGAARGGKQKALTHLTI